LILEFLCIVCLMYLLAVTLITFLGLSAPVGFPVDQEGMTDFQIFTPLLLGLFIFFVLSLLNRFPWLYSYIVPITQRNRDKQYGSARLLLTLSKLWILIVVILDFQYRTGYPITKPGSPGELILYISLGIFLFLALLVYMIYSISTG